jgi:translation initiation factor IF-1
MGLSKQILRRATRRMRAYASALLVLAAAMLSGCEHVALMPRPTLESRGPPERVTATIDGVDHQLQELYLLDGNQHYVVCYLSGTRVLAQGRDHPAASLRTGDRVEVELREGADRRLYADQIRVVGSGGASAATRTRNIEGTVERVSLDRGMLEVRARNGELLTIYVPESSSAETRERFLRLWVGDYVRLEGESLSENRIELLAFR